MVDHHVESPTVSTCLTRKNSSSIQTPTAMPTSKINVNESNRLPDFINDTGKTTYQNVKQHNLKDWPTMYSNIQTINKQRPTVIRPVGNVIPITKDYTVVPATEVPFLQTPDIKCLPKSCNQQKGKGRTVFSDGSASSKPILRNAERKYYCQFCGKLFQWRSHWQSHERIHTGERPFQCAECGKAFTRSDGLQCHKLTHVRKTTCSNFPGENSHHVESNLFQNEHCRPELNDRDTSEKQTVMHEQKLHKCQFCGRGFFSPTWFMKHVQGHQGKKEFTCDTCNMAFSKKSALEIHSRVHTGVKPYRCNVCTRAFSIYGNLKRHLLIHTRERPYMCSICSQSFNNPSHLTRHMKSKHATSNSCE